MGRKLHISVIRSGAAPLPTALMVEMEQLFGVPVIEGYGLTETTQQVSVNPLPPGERRPGSVGIPGRTEVGIISEEGELAAVGSDRRDRSARTGCHGGLRE